MSNYFQTEHSEAPAQLVMDEHGKAYMLEAARWTKFLGITYSIVVGLLVIIMPVAMNMASTMASAYQQATPMPDMTAFGTVFAVVMLALNIYPLYTMLAASTLLKKAILNNDQQKFNAGLKQARNHMKFAGILTILLISFYGIIILFNLIVVLTASSVG
jgi:hypothetical protein